MFGVCRVALEGASWMQTHLWTILLSSLNFWRNVVISICAIANKISPRKYIIRWIGNSCLFDLLFRNIIGFVAWVANEFSSIYFKLAFKAVFNIFLDWIFEIVACVCCKILKFTLRQDLIVRLVVYLLTNSDSLVVEIRCIVRSPIELPTNF